MDCRQHRRFKPSRLLIATAALAFLALFPAKLLVAQDNLYESARELEVRLETTPVHPKVHERWSLTVLVNHPYPEEVDVGFPPPPESLVLEQILTSSAFIEGARWTKVEYRLTPLASGTVPLQPLTVHVLGQEVLSPALTIDFQDGATDVGSPFFRWLQPIPPFHSGERGEITLELSGWDTGQKQPSGIFRGRAPVNAIIRELPIVPAPGAHGTYRYPLTFIPLDKNDVTLAAFSFVFEGISLTVPEITIPVLPARAKELAPVESIQGDTSRVEPVVPSTSLPHPFPESNTQRIFLPLQKSYNNVIEKIKALWEENLTAEALALVRKHERDNLLGARFTSLRRELEKRLNLRASYDERWQPLGISLAAWITLGIIIVGTAVSMRAMQKRRHIALLIPFVALLLILAVFLTVTVSRVSPRGKIAVLTQTEAYRLPDSLSTVQTNFDNGQSVSVLLREQSWCYVKASDGRAGWIPRRSVLEY